MQVTRKRRLKLTIHDVDIGLTTWGDLASGLPVVALHGFTGSSLDFELLGSSLSQGSPLVGLDLLGHGCSDSPESKGVYKMPAQLERLAACIHALGIKAYILLGYSMGGRIALHYTLSRPCGLRGLVLVGAHPGLESESECSQRFDQDLQLAQQIRRQGVPWFIEYWQDQPLIASQKNLPASCFPSFLERRYQNNPRGLALTLENLSPGVVRSVWEELQNIACPCMLVSGEQDLKYTSIHEKMNALIPQSSHVILPHAGHMAYLENQNAFLTVFKPWLTELGTPCSKRA